MEHCTYATDCHNHLESRNVLTPNPSGNVTFTAVFEDHGQNTSQVFNFSVTDKAGVASSWTYRASPDLRTITVISPVGVSIDGIETNNLQVAVGSNNSVSVPSSFGASRLTKWSNGDTDNQTSFVMPSRDVALTAVFANAIDDYAVVLGTRAGAPIGPEVPVAGGWSRAYQNTTIYWTADTGAHEVRNGILGKYLALGGPAVVGFPTTDETLTPDGRGAFSRFTGGEIYWTPATGSQLVAGPTLQKWAELGRERSPLGYPVTDQLDAGSAGTYSAFENGYIVWRADTDAHYVVNGIRARYDALGGSRGRLGFPRTDETPTPDGIGYYNYFTGGAVYWSPSTGPFGVFGAILQKWVDLGSERSRLGYPTSNELDAGSGGYYSSFQNGYLVWRGDTGAHLVVNGIRWYYDSLGGSRGFLGFPTTDEIATPDGVGAYNDFTGGSVYWSPTTGVHEVHGGNYGAWSRTGREQGPLGYPTPTSSHSAGRPGQLLPARQSAVDARHRFPPGGQRHQLGVRQPRRPGWLPRVPHHGRDRGQRRMAKRFPGRFDLLQQRGRGDRQSRVARADRPAAFTEPVWFVCRPALPACARKRCRASPTRRS